VLRALVIIVAALTLVGAATGVYLYDRATAIDRSTPAVVARQFMQASVVERDPARVGLFICGEWSAEQALAETAAQIDPEAKASWTVGTAEPVSEGMAIVPILLKLQYPGEVAPSGREGWVLSLRDEQGWRVCSVDRGTGP
jgi:hypothetical protein